jgi:glycosyltransferase involved in cell wall biosynthesis
MIINYAMDEMSQVFSHQADVANRLSPNFGKVTVLTAHKGSFEVSENVSVISFDWIEGKRFISSLRFFQIFLREIFKNRPDVLFSHMTSTHSSLIAPLTRLLRIKHYLWYAHTSDNWYLRVSKRFTNGIITSTPGSCPLVGKKIFPIGQSIDKSQFEKRSQISVPIKNFIHTGRLDPSKNIELIIDTVKNLRASKSDLTLEIVGSPSSEKYKEYAQNLISTYNSKDYLSWLKFKPYVPREELPKLLRTKDVFIHAFEGSLDKTLVEAIFTALPVITLNKEFIKEFGSWNSTDSTDQINLMNEGTTVLEMAKSELELEINRRYEVAIKDHEIKGWIDRLVEILRS